MQRCMIDYFSIALTHGLILVALWRLLGRNDLDVDDAHTAQRPRPWLKDASSSGGTKEGDRARDA